MSSTIKLKNGNLISVSDFIVIKYRLNKGINVFGNEENPFFRELMSETASEAAWLIAAKGIVAEAQTVEKLQKKGYPQYAIESAIRKLKEYNYINDIEFIKKYVTTKKYGKLRVYDELEKKGIDIHEIREFYEENDWIEQHNLEENIAQLSGKSKEQTAGVLIRRGFDPEMVKSRMGIEE